MTPTLIGRIQTRVVLLATVGLLWTLLVTPLLSRTRFSTTDDVYPATLRALFWTALFGAVLWEPLYHFVQQWRWEKDWPIGLGLVTGVNEAVLVFLVMRPSIDGAGATTATFWQHFISTWIVVWAVANGPIRALLPRWRYRGGRIL